MKLDSHTAGPRVTRITLCQFVAFRRSAAGPQWARAARGLNGHTSHAFTVSQSHSGRMPLGQPLGLAYLIHRGKLIRHAGSHGIRADPEQKGEHDSEITLRCSVAAAAAQARRLTLSPGQCPGPRPGIGPRDRDLVGTGGHAVTGTVLRLSLTRSHCHVAPAVGLGGLSD